ncbi:MAG: putative sugar O-methyltransferase [Syntrophales bacterium]|jgi:putative sugar O-methyltransferase
MMISAYQYFLQLRQRNKKFELWWKGYTGKNNLPTDLIFMVDYFITRPSFKECSRYWHWLNIKNIQQISDSGYDNFKQTVAKNYFTWVGGLDTPYTRNLLNNIKDISIDLPAKEILRKHSDFTFEESVLYNVVTVLLLEHLLENGGGKYIELLEEPLEGNPPSLDFSGKTVSQDILNSILEYMAISKGCDLNKVSTILELGAGSGRTAFCMLKLLPGIKYIIVDIPPALFISQTYLSKVFKEKKIFSFRPFNAFSDIKDEFKSSDIVFLMPDQIELLPQKTVDLFLAIDCLHEMKTEQVQRYFDHVDKLAKLFFFKCWENTTVPFDNIKHASEFYPVKDNWHKIYKEACKVPASYFEAFYEIK